MTKTRGSAIAIADAVRGGRLRAADAVEEALARIAAHGELGAFAHVAAERARESAASVDAAVARGEDPGALAGVPIGVKDAEACAGMPLTHGSLLRVDDPPQSRDSIHVARLRAAGAVPVGMTSVPEFEVTAFTRSRAHGVARNPWNPERTPGGSSGGSASAVAAGLVPLATAGDGGGSTRIPASFCGLVGHKSSYGRIPREGAVTSQTAVWGVLATSVADAARHLDVAAGPDDRDRTSLPAAGLCYERASAEHDVRGLRAAWSDDLGYAVVDPEVAALARSAAERLMAAAELERVDTRVAFEDPFHLWLGVNAIDFWLHLEKDEWPARADELMRSNRASFEASETMVTPQHARFLVRRSRVEAQVAEAFTQLDVLLTPTTAVPAFAAKGPPPREIAGREVHPAMAVPFTMFANLCWNPATSVPAGCTREGLPVGLQIMVRRHRDDLALRLARIAEEAAPWPPVAPGYEPFSLSR